MIATTALALCSVAAAAEFSAEALPATITGSDAASTFTAEGGEVSCTATLSGSLSEASTSLALTPSYTKCKAFGFLEGTVNTEGCKFVLHGGSETAEEETYAVSTDISCETGKSIKVTAGTCSLEIGTQSGLSGGKMAEETVTAPEHATLGGKVAKVVYTVTKDGFLCPLNGTGKKENGELGGSATLTASGEGLPEDGFTLASAYAAPASLVFTAAEQTKTAAIYFADPGTYVINEQNLFYSSEGFLLSTSSKTSCPGDVVNGGTGAACPYTVRTTAKSTAGTSDIVETKWMPKGAKYARVIRSEVSRK